VHKLENIGVAITKARKKSGLTQTQLAKKIKMHQGEVSRYERGTTYPSLETLFKIYKALKINLNDLF